MTKATLRSSKKKKPTYGSKPYVGECSKCGRVKVLQLISWCHHGFRFVCEECAKIHVPDPNCTTSKDIRPRYA